MCRSGHGSTSCAFGRVPRACSVVHCPSHVASSPAWLLALEPVDIITCNSLCRQFAYIVGVTLYGIYTINYRLWPILAPTAMEFVVIWMSIVVKCITDRKRREKERLEAPASSSKVEVVGHKLATQTTAVDQKDLADVDLEMQSTYTEDRTPSACKPP